MRDDFISLLLPHRRQRLDPLTVLQHSSDPTWVAWAIYKLECAGFSDPFAIAYDCGWEVR